MTLHREGGKQDGFGFTSRRAQGIQSVPLDPRALLIYFWENLDVFENWTKAENVVPRNKTYTGSLYSRL